MRKERIINLTPHPINILDEEENEVEVFPTFEIVKGESIPNGVARLETRTELVGTHCGVPITKTVFGEPKDLPEPEEGTLFIVSQLIKSALPHRTDLVVPAEVVRDDIGRIIGCRSLGV